jgi:hypothetical protein
LTVPSDCNLEKGCASNILATLNGGTSWNQVGIIPDGPQTLPVRDIRFANPRDGYAFNPDLYVTTDGGHTWTPETGPNVVSLEVQGPNVVRISSTSSGCPGPCGITVERAPIGSTSWSVLYSYPKDTEAGAVELVAQGSDDLYVVTYENPAGGAQNEQSLWLISHNGGATWHTRSDPCGYSGTTENDTVGLAAAPGDVVAVLCAPRLTGTSFVKVSGDGGLNFGSPSLLPTNAGFKLIGATSGQDIFVAGSPGAGNPSVLAASHNGGASWQVVASGSVINPVMEYGYAGFLGFESPAVGRWVGNPQVIWTTYDGGYTWVSAPS